MVGAHQKWWGCVLCQVGSAIRAKLQVLLRSFSFGERKVSSKCNLASSSDTVSSSLRGGIPYSEKWWRQSSFATWKQLWWATCPEFPFALLNPLSVSQRKLFGANCYSPQVFLISISHPGQPLASQPAPLLLQIICLFSEELAIKTHKNWGYRVARNLACSSLTRAKGRCCSSTDNLIENDPSAGAFLGDGLCSGPISSSELKKMMLSSWNTQQTFAKAAWKLEGPWRQTPRGFVWYWFNLTVLCNLKSQKFVPEQQLG